MAIQPRRPHDHGIRPAQRVTLRRRSGDELDVQQAGRSATHLHAQVSVQTLRQSSRPSLRQRVSDPPVQPSHHANTNLPSVQEHIGRTRQDSHTTTRYAPTVPSPLNPACSKEGIDGTMRKTSDQSFGHLVTSPGSKRVEDPIALEPESIAPVSKAQTLSKRCSEVSQAESSTIVSRSTEPTSIRDLGSDYCRYFNPFATQRDSQQDLSADDPTLRLQPKRGTAVTELAKRLSNPFSDNRRASSPFESSDDVVPATPQPVRREVEKIQVVVPAAMPMGSEMPIFISNADPEKAVFYPWVNDRLGAPFDVPLYVNEAEEDDDMHMPRWDDDMRYKPRWKERLSKDNIVNTLGVVLILAGLAMIFIALPIVSFLGTNLIPYDYETPLDQMPHPGDNSWYHVNDRNYPHLHEIRTTLIDPDTPDSAKQRLSVDGDVLELVFSDEFNAKNRTFYEGDDPFWFAPDIWYGATGDLEWYDPDAVNTGDGTLQLQLDAFANHGLEWRSGMLNSWNQLCFKGGVFEVSMSLPGPAGVHGLWPGAWTMGNLGRPGYLATTDGVWPYTYDSCDVGITPNQSQTDGLSYLPGQRLSQCTCDGEDHPSLGTGRGAPEIDIAEVSGDYSGLGIGVATQSFQVAPFDIWYHPNYDFMENPNYNISLVNTWCGGPYQQAVSTTTMLNNQWYDGREYQKYSFEYEPGTSQNSHITWFVGEDETMRFDARAIGPNGNIRQRVISEEPMSMILNLGFSHSWVDIDMAHLQFPTILRVDYVRWYQKKGNEIVTCDPPGYETTDYIARHPVAYSNPNITHWKDAGYSWPKNTLMHGCSI